jgi:hypothetical protein
MDWDRFQALTREMEETVKKRQSLIAARQAEEPAHCRFFPGTPEGARDHSERFERVYGDPTVEALYLRITQIQREQGILAKSEFPDLGYALAETLVKSGFDRTNIQTAPDTVLSTVRLVGKRTLATLRARYPYRPPAHNTHFAERVFPFI